MQIVAFLLTTVMFGWQAITVTEASLWWLGVSGVVGSLGMVIWKVRQYRQLYPEGR